MNKPPSRRIPGSLDTSQHSDLMRKRGLSGEPYLTDMDRVTYKRLVEMWQITIFRMTICEEAKWGCQETVPSNSGKRWCSKVCHDKAMARVQESEMELIKSRVRTLLEEKKK